ncbi:MAG: hypothetical protein ACI30V_01005 [Muribaculaceae bacterium]
MKNNIDPNNTGELLEMAQRYFDATLSKSEERDLMLAIAGSTDPRLDELKAVMAFAACGKAKHRQQRRVSRLAWRYGVAASIAAVIAIAAISLGGSGSEAIAYVGGEPVTDQEQVMQQMFSAMQTIDLNHADNIVDEELKIMFNTIN